MALHHGQDLHELETLSRPSVIKSLQLAQVQTLRTMHVTLGAFSLALVLLMIARILNDARRVAAYQVPLRPKKLGFLLNVHPAEVFPLVLASGIAIQEIVFITVQSTALDSLVIKGCRGIAMATYPALFLLGYLHIVFGAEVAIRGLKADRFAPRSRWTTRICLGVVLFLLILTLLPTIIWVSPNHCIGSLIWFPIRYEFITLVIIIVFVVTFLILAAVISMQLMRSINVDPNERIVASRICYYLCATTILYALFLPFHIQVRRHDLDESLATSRIAEIPLFASGIFISFIHLFLRVNASRMVIKPVGVPRQKRPKLRFFGPSDLEMNISGPMMHRPASQDRLVHEKQRMDGEPEEMNYYNRLEKGPQSIKSPMTPTPRGVDPSKWPLPPAPLSVEGNRFTANFSHKRAKSSYSLFPTRAEEIPRLPATIYTPSSTAKQPAFSAADKRQTSMSTAPSVTDVHEASLQWLNPPSPLFSSQRHRRDDSNDSSATVQIGLRFSVAPAAIAAADCIAATRMPQSQKPGNLRRNESNDSSGSESLGLPIQAPSDLSSNDNSDSNSDTDLPRQTNEPLQALAPVVVSPSAFSMITPQNSGSYLQAARNKVLPPTPRGSAVPPPLQPGLSGLRMNPVSPASVVGSPREKGIRSPVRSPTGKGVGPGEGTMARSPPRDGSWI
ncbi:uncharacterized protein BDZ99DRAFT_508292 [Mytilinidion resinicola]|uniref:Uncharacterized protein n=1 Tax=Mytilinidion resinicola TaxID=574789 RepID=A0A6A6YQN8_9PEZI|nr:uncharacterized protein BDZ99DRAFT_508292 [Mytilinidion resinicola]KAF2810829.1 hypothetical protein BDZ99DRAFT_508292 [Mytilinidion resinicola]